MIVIPLAGLKDRPSLEKEEGRVRREGKKNESEEMSAIFHGPR